MNADTYRNQSWQQRGTTAAVVALILIAVSFQPGQTAPAKTPFVDLSSHWTWVDEGWTGNNAAYDKIRNELETLVPGTVPFQSALDKYAILAQNRPADPLVQFQWAYLARRLASISDVASPSIQRMMSDVNQALASTPSPHTYQYTRLRLLAGNWSPTYYSPERLSHTRALGERLLHHTPNDYAVKYVLASILDVSGRPEDRQLALRYAQELIQAEPSQASNHALLGGIYYRSWLITRHPEDADKAVAAYQQYLALAPANQNQTYREVTQRLIDRLKQRS